MGDERHEDRELLEAHLDGALEPPEAESLYRRLARDVALAAELDVLRAERARRLALWTAYEPSDADASEAADRVMAAAAHGERWLKATRLARRASAVAAVVALAFAGGWYARGRHGAADPPPAVRVGSDGGGSHPLVTTGAATDPMADRARESFPQSNPAEPAPGDF